MDQQFEELPDDQQVQNTVETFWDEEKLQGQTPTAVGRLEHDDPSLMVDMRPPSGVDKNGNEILDGQLCRDENVEQVGFHDAFKMQ